jgi:hypothetical protein
MARGRKPVSPNLDGTDVAAKLIGVSPTAYGVAVDARGPPPSSEFSFGKAKVNGGKTKVNGQGHLHARRRHLRHQEQEDQAGEEAARSGTGCHQPPPETPLSRRPGGGGFACC